MFGLGLSLPPFLDFGLSGDAHTAAPGLSGGGAEVRGHADVAGTGVSGATSGDVAYDPATGTASGVAGTGGAFNLNLGPLGSVSIGGDADASGSGDLSSGSARGKMMGFLSGSLLGHSFSESGKIGGGFSW